MFVINRGPQGTGSYWRCLDCPAGLIEHGDKSEEAADHTRQTGHQTEYGRFEWVVIYSMRTKVPLPAVRSGTGWPAFADQGWSSGTAGVDDDRP